MRNLLNASVSRVTTQIGCALFVRIVEPVAAAEIAMRPSPRNDGESHAVGNSRRQSARIPLRDPHDLSSKNPVLDRCDRVPGPLFFAVVAVRCAIRTTGLREVPRRSERSLRIWPHGLHLTKQLVFTMIDSWITMPCSAIRHRSQRFPLQNGAGRHTDIVFGVRFPCA